MAILLLRDSEGNHGDLRETGPRREKQEARGAPQLPFRASDCGARGSREAEGGVWRGACIVGWGGGGAENVCKPTAGNKRA